MTRHNFIHQKPNNETVSALTVVEGTLERKRYRGNWRVKILSNGRGWLPPI